MDRVDCELVYSEDTTTKTMLPDLKTTFKLNYNFKKTTIMKNQHVGHTESDVSSCG